MLICKKVVITKCLILARVCISVLTGADGLFNQTEYICKVKVYDGVGNNEKSEEILVVN